MKKITYNVIVNSQLKQLEGFYWILNQPLASPADILRGASREGQERMTYPLECLRGRLTNHGNPTSLPTGPKK